MSTKPYKKSIFLFRRDLRIVDNSGLIQAARSSQQVIPLFIFDPVQVGLKNRYRSANAIQFMVESVADLDRELHKKKSQLRIFYGNTLTIMKKLLAKKDIDALFLNYDYTPFSTKRDHALEQLCTKKKKQFHGFHDELLIGDPSSIRTGNKTAYSIYSAFYKKAATKKVAKPIVRMSISWHKGMLPGTQSAAAIFKKVLKKENPEIKIRGGRSTALKIVRTLKKYKNYTKERNFPALDATTHLSAPHKFNVISIRESYYAIKKALRGRTQLLKELYWRDFFTYVAFHNPHVFGKPYYKKYEQLRWRKSKKDFEAWCKGLTGFPIVDAGMRQLNTTGWMHNRVRMIVASFLVKDLHINWLWGERYFAQQLVDYDPAVNNGNWQWSASTGCDAQPYFRIFNPWTQQKRFDPKCAYIKQWIPELKKVAINIIHTWFKENHESIIGYPRPMVDHDKERSIALAMYKSMQNKG